jgi:hypothetical protein
MVNLFHTWKNFYNCEHKKNMANDVIHDMGMKNGFVAGNEYHRTLHKNSRTAHKPLSALCPAF